jgi:hypothetical protein
MRAAARASGVRGTREMRNGRSLGRIPFAAVLVELCAVVLAEFRRAIAAARRYEDLRYGSGGQQGRAHADSPRQVFEEFYSSARPTEARRPADQGRTRQPITYSGKSMIEDPTPMRPPLAIQAAPLVRMASGSSPRGEDLP